MAEVLLLPLTKAVQKLLDEGKVEEAMRLHNATLHERMRAAEADAIIDLTDLMASHEEIAYRALAHRKEEVAR